MTTTIIITLCILVLIAYVFDLTSAKTKIPSVILLLLLGWILRQLTNSLSIDIPNLSEALPVLGTIGLILIVLEGSLELELNRSKASLIGKSLVTALIPIVALAFGLSWAFQQAGYAGWRITMVNALPLCVISSAIAIPTVRSLSQPNREFIVYESSLSDIIGVLVFNFIALHTTFGWETFGGFFLELLIIVVLSFAATLGLAVLLRRIDHHVKFVPIILLTILIYAVSKIYHLPGLLFILIFGLFLGNLNELKNFRWIEKLKPDELDKEVHKLKDLTIEGAFLIRALFFLVFGYLIETQELMNAGTLLWAAGITAAIFIVRVLLLGVMRLPLSPLLFIAPRGLITILLFLSVDPQLALPVVSRSLVIQVIVLTALVMMVGMILHKPAAEEAASEARPS